MPNSGIPSWSVLAPSPPTPKQQTSSRSTRQEEFYNEKIISIAPIRTGKVDGLLGLEIECEGKNLTTDLISWWDVHSDGSLRCGVCKKSSCSCDNSNGRPLEYVFKKPLDIDDAKKALYYLDKKLNTANSVVMPSPRTSVHVHVNCQQLTLKEVYNYITLYTIFEEMLVEWSGPDRVGNLFCLRAIDSDYYVNMLESVILQKSFKAWREDYRYSACNVASINKFGSLEFRSMRGTADPSLILLWIGLLLHIREKALKYKNPSAIIEDFMQSGPLPFFMKIFDKPDYRKLFETTQELSTKMWRGVRIIKDVAYVCEWKEAKKKQLLQPQEEPKPKKYRVDDTIYIAGLGECKVRVRFGPSQANVTYTYPSANVYTIHLNQHEAMLYVETLTPFHAYLKLDVLSIDDVEYLEDEEEE